MILELHPLHREDFPIAVKAEAIMCFYPEGKGTAIMLEFYGDGPDDTGRTIAVNVKESYRDIFDTLQKCGDTITLISARKRRRFDKITESPVALAYFVRNIGCNVGHYQYPDGFPPYADPDEMVKWLEQEG